MSTSYKNLESENLVLREYIITLQSRLLESGHAEFPPAPIDLSRPSVRISAAAAAAAAAAVATNRIQEDSLSVEDRLQDRLRTVAVAGIAHDDDEMDQNDGDEGDDGEDDIRKIENGALHGHAYHDRRPRAESVAEHDQSEGSHAS